eukprot:c41502_g1_i1 orf=1-207(-)
MADDEVLAPGWLVVSLWAASALKLAFYFFCYLLSVGVVLEPVYSFQCEQPLSRIAWLWLSSLFLSIIVR